MSLSMNNGGLKFFAPAQDSKNEDF